MLGFGGLTHADSRFANNGNQFSGEPPDQALCVGNGFTFEMVAGHDVGTEPIPVSTRW